MENTLLESDFHINDLDRCLMQIHELEMCLNQIREYIQRIDKFDGTVVLSSLSSALHDAKQDLDEMLQTI